MADDNDRRNSRRSHRSHSGESHRPERGSRPRSGDGSQVGSASDYGSDSQAGSPTEYGREASGSSDNQRSHRRSSRKRSRRKSTSATELYKCKRVLTVFKALTFLLLIALIIGGLFARSYISQAEEEVASNTHKIKQLRDGRQMWKSRIEQLERELASHVAGNLPDLNPLTYDQVIEVDQAYVKNLVFSVSRKAGEASYEYQMVLHNRSPIVIQPRVKILLFDRTGLQIGISDLKGIKDNVLIPEESRSMHESFDILLEHREPAYFMVITK